MYIITANAMDTTERAGREGPRSAGPRRQLKRARHVAAAGCSRCPGSRRATGNGRGRAGPWLALLVLPRCNDRVARPVRQQSCHDYQVWPTHACANGRKGRTARAPPCGFPGGQTEDRDSSVELGALCSAALGRLVCRLRRNSSTPLTGCQCTCRGTRCPWPACRPLPGPR